jgi:hypothetical protein
MSFLNSQILLKLPGNFTDWYVGGGGGELEISVTECITCVQDAPTHVLLEQ